MGPGADHAKVASVTASALSTVLNVTSRTPIRLCSRSATTLASGPGAGTVPAAGIGYAVDRAV